MTKSTNVIQFRNYRKRIITKIIPEEGRTPQQTHEPISPRQREQLKRKIHMAFFSWVFGDSDIHHMYNRIRAQYGLNRFEDLPAEHFEEVVLMVENTKKINKKLLDILTECRNEYIKNHIDAGAPWTADLKRKWRKKINTALSEKPNWLEIQRRITDD